MRNVDLSETAFKMGLPDLISAYKYLVRKEIECYRGFSLTFSWNYAIEKGFDIYGIESSCVAYILSGRLQIWGI